MLVIVEALGVHCTAVIRESQRQANAILQVLSSLSATVHGQPRKQREGLPQLTTTARAMIALVLMAALSGVGRAEETPSCAYCADWKPLSGHRFLSGEVLIVRMDQVALPGCAAAKATFLREQPHPSITTEEGLPPALLVYFRLEESPYCSPAVSGAMPGALLELEYVPTLGRKGGEVELRVLHARDIPDTDRTGSSAQWFAVRTEERWR